MKKFRPNATRNDFAGAPISAEKDEEYFSSNSAHGIKEAIITQRLSDDNFPSKVSSKFSGGIVVCSCFRYMVTNDTRGVLLVTVMQGFWVILLSSLAPEYLSLV